jgi:uncharacterized protein YbaP (TraB family)
MINTMKFLTIIFFFFVVYFSNAQLLWKISGNGVKQNSYLYGTIHVMPKEKFTISPKIQDAINSSSKMAMEVDLDMDLKTKIRVAQEMILPNGKTLRNYLSAEEFNRLNTYCLDSLKLKKGKLKKYYRLKPFFFSSVVAQEQMGEISSYEMEFMKIAKKRKMTMIGLESIEFQMQTINKITVEDQAKMLMQEFGSNPTEQFDDMLNLYLKEDLEGLYKVVSEESNAIPEFNYNFLEVRNKNWIPVIEKNIASNTFFIAVGAAHLPGENGVIQLLRSKGYSVEPIN